MRWLDWTNVVLIVPLAVIIRLQQRRVHAGWFTDYGADVLGTAWCWWLLRRGLFSYLPAPAELCVFGVFVAGVLYEVAKTVRLIRGTYDPINIIYYAVTLIACYALERILRRRHLRA